MKRKIILLFIIAISYIYVLLLSSPSAISICCPEGCSPSANCCVTPCCENNPVEGGSCISYNINPFCGRGVEGCLVKTGSGTSYLCAGDLLVISGSNTCGVCQCANENDCSWSVNNALCPSADFCSITYQGDAAVSSSCIQRCPEGTRLCADNTCQAVCSEHQDVVCDGNCNDGKGDSCLCPECFGKQSTCNTGLTCDQYTNVCVGTCPCSEGTTLCKDGYCRTNCYLNSGLGPTPDTGDAVCNACGNPPSVPQEGCTVPSCASENSPCDAGLYCKNGLCTKIPTDCPSCSDCSGGSCTIDKCHGCDSGKCYFYKTAILQTNKCGDCPASQCSDYKEDIPACNAQVPGCNKNCYWAGTACKTCGDVTACSGYTVRETCLANPCKVGTCAWASGKCSPALRSDPDDLPSNCENYDTAAIQGICDTSGETNCWDEKSADKAAKIKCCGDDAKEDFWVNQDGSGCVEGVYFTKRDEHKRLCGPECLDKSLTCWSTTVNIAYEDSLKTRCCEQGDIWHYSTNRLLSDILVSASCVGTEWYSVTRQGTVTYHELTR